MPTMLRLFLVVCMASLLAILLGRWLEGSAHEETPAGKKLRKRVTFCLVLAALLILTRLSIFWLQSSSPLTDLTPEQYNAQLEFVYFLDATEAALRKSYTRSKWSFVLD